MSINLGRAVVSEAVGTRLNTALWGSSTYRTIVGKTQFPRLHTYILVCIASARFLCLISVGISPCLPPLPNSPHPHPTSLWPQPFLPRHRHPPPPRVHPLLPTPTSAGTTLSPSLLTPPPSIHSSYTAHPCGCVPFFHVGRIQNTN